ncbi:hypothetical protein C8F04DRAFT_243849 [Mycena alexandri]|uniref:Novel STAND NTPase 1 domain-containing protein n=1 Tax=Mycena alexandri TaxID=1745969 RepID=A0AAD6WSR6_9AGAR|nr:hypothetical protein C8F04DRAFT_243849 [Mycena alexandri]
MRSPTPPARMVPPPSAGHTLVRIPGGTVRITLRNIPCLVTSIQSSNSFSMLPSEPKIFHGRESELTEIIRLFQRATPRIAILGAGGMGKTCLARCVLHHPEVCARYSQHRYFVACDSATTSLELVALIASHLGLRPGKDLTQPVISYFSDPAPSFLILDNLESVWEPAESRRQVEELLSHLTNINHLALIVTMRGAERPEKVMWTRPFLPPLQPLAQRAAREIFLAITDDIYALEDVDSVLSLTDNMPLAIHLLAHLVDSEGCSRVLSRWQEEKTSLVSDGYDKRDNLGLSISLSLSSPRMKARPDSQHLLSLLSILPDGLSDAELQQSKLLVNNVLGCKTALLCTALGYLDEQKRLKVLVPIREYVHRFQPPTHDHVRPLLKYFTELLNLRIQYSGHLASSQIVARISSNYFNIQNMLLEGLQHDDPDSIYSICNLNRFSLVCSRGTIPLFSQVYESLPNLSSHHVQAYIIAEWFNSFQHYRIPDPERLVVEALDHFKYFDDPDLQCRFYNSLGYYYLEQKVDLAEARKYCEAALSLARSTSNRTAQSNSLHRLAWIMWHIGDYSTAQGYAFESQILARISGDLFREGQALHIEAVCLTEMGHYARSISRCIRAKNLITSCGMSGGATDHAVTSSKAEVHKLKSEYMEARNIHNQILQGASMEHDKYSHAYALFNIADIDIAMGNFGDDVRESLARAESIFKAVGDEGAVQWCEVVRADIKSNDGDLTAARTLLESSLRFSLGKNAEMSLHCLGKLANSASWGSIKGTPHWPAVFLARSSKLKQRLGIHRALQFIGDIFWAHGDLDTAVSLFTVALDGFTAMDVHRSKGECMYRLGNIYEQDGDLLKALEFWGTARTLFERSCQPKDVENIDRKLRGFEEDIHLT